MKYTPKRSKNYFGKVFGIVAFIVALAVFFKPAMRCFYPVKYTGEIKKYSSMYALDEHLVMAVISTESKFQKNAVSRKGAKGLMQLREKTALWCMENFKIDGRIEEIFNPDLNIHIGCAYLKYLSQKFGGSTNTVLAAYNAGEGNVTKWLAEQSLLGEVADIPFGETKRYIDRVNQKTKIYQFLY